MPEAIAGEPATPHRGAIQTDDGTATLDALMAQRYRATITTVILTAIGLTVAACSGGTESLRIDSPASSPASTESVVSTESPPSGDTPTSETNTDVDTDQTESSDTTEGNTDTTDVDADETSRSGREAGPATEVSGNLVPVVISEHPHDDTSWTQGLEFHDGRLLESTGRYELSTLRLVDIETGQPTELVELPDDLYAEGVTIVEGRAIQITWQDETVVVTELDELSSRTPTERPDAYEGEGWGLCFDGVDLVMSDGSNRLTFRDPETFEPLRTIDVSLNGAPLQDLNELECVGGRIWANVWLTPTIVVINATSGDVEASIDASSLVPSGYENVSDAVLNGIAYNPELDTFWLTGKLWPVLYQVTFEPS